MKVTEDQFRYEWFSGTGAGGQHRNKKQNSCRCIHEPTGITSTAQGRSREANKSDAYISCLSKIRAHFHEDKARNLAGTERIRTYHECDNRVVDHASGLTDTYTNVMDKGALDEMIEARAKSTR